MIRRLLRLARERRGVGAVEFAVSAPFLILLYIGGYQLMDAISAYRKVTTATRTMADLTTRQVKVTEDQVEAIIDASKQIMAPYSTTGAVLRITQITFDNDGKPTVDWSISSGGNKMKNSDLFRHKNTRNCNKDKPDKIEIPCEIAIPGTYVIYSELTYPYVPVVGDGLVGTIKFHDDLFMNPRRSNEVQCVRNGDGNENKGNDGC
jgi:hypothetical protein